MNLHIKVFNTEKVLTADSIEEIHVTAGLMQAQEEGEDVQVLELKRAYPITTSAAEIKADLVRARDNFVKENETRENDKEVAATISELNGLEIE